MEEKRKVTILRGIPGTGKSSFARGTYPDAYIISADDFMMEDGKYVFSKERQANAHKMCLLNYIAALGLGVTISQWISNWSRYTEEYGLKKHIIVDNTNCSPAEIAPYAALAQTYEFELKILTMRIDNPMIALRRNIHGIQATEEGANYWQKRLDFGTTQLPARWPHSLVSLEIIKDTTSYPPPPLNMRERKA